jgi:uncharacterized protein
MRSPEAFAFALRITALMFVTMAVAALAIDGLFTLAGLIPSGARPSRDEIFGSIQVDYKLFLNLLGLVVFIALFSLTQRRGVTDPVCGMTVDRAKAITKEFGGEDVLLLLRALPARFRAGPPAVRRSEAGARHHR